MKWHFRNSGQILRYSVGKSMSLEVRDTWIRIMALPFISFVTSGKLLHLWGSTFLVYKMDIVPCKAIGRLKDGKHLLSAWHSVGTQLMVAYASMWDLALTYTHKRRKPVNFPDQLCSGGYIGPWVPLYSVVSKGFLRYWGSALAWRKYFRFGGVESSSPVPHPSFVALLDFSASGIFRYV